MGNLPAPFALERYFARHEFTAPHLLCCSDSESFTIDELLALEPGSRERLLSLPLGYGESTGAPELRAVVADLYDGCTPEQVLIHSGAEEALFVFMHVVLSAGDHVIVPTPCYQSLSELPRTLGCQVDEWAARPAIEWRFSLDDLEGLLRPSTRVVVVNGPHNPTGARLTADDMHRLVDLSRRRGFLVLSDEVYRWLEHDPADRPPALVELDDRGCSVGVMSKTFGLPGLRIGWVATRNDDLLRRMASFKDYTTICNAVPSEFFATLALRHRSVIVERNLAIAAANLTLLDDFMTRRSALFTWQRPRAGVLAFPALTGSGVASPFCRRLLDRTGVLLAPGELFGARWGSHLRIGFGRRSFAAGLCVLDEFCDEHDGA